jgi:hypothetical protein
MPLVQKQFFSEFLSIYSLTDNKIFYAESMMGLTRIIEWKIVIQANTKRIFFIGNFPSKEFLENKK